MKMKREQCEDNKQSVDVQDTVFSIECVPFSAQLRNPFQINSYMKYAALPAMFDPNIFQTYRGLCTVVGWGRHIPGSNVRGRQR